MNAETAVHMAQDTGFHELYAFWEAKHATNYGPSKRPRRRWKSLLVFELKFQPLATLPSLLGPADSHDRRSMRLFLYGVELAGYPWARGVQGRLQSVHGRGLPLDDGWMVFAALIGSERGE